MNMRIGVLMIIDDPETVKAYSASLLADDNIHDALHNHRAWIETTWLEAQPEPPSQQRNFEVVDPMDLAAAILSHIDTAYPAMWQRVPKSARSSLRNTIIRLARGLPQRIETKDERNPYCSPGATSQPLSDQGDTVDGPLSRV